MDKWKKLVSMKNLFKSLINLSRQEIITKTIFNLLYIYEILSIKIYKFITLIYIKDKRDYLERKKLYVFVPVWGEKFIDIFLSYSLPSISSDGNLTLLQKKMEVTFFFYTKKESFEILKEKLKGFNYKFNIVLESDLPSYRRTLNKFFSDMLSKGVKDEAMIFLSPPDQIWSEYSIYNMVKMANGKCVNIAVPHGRVSHSCISKEEENIQKNKKNDSRSMVDIFLDCQHKSFKCSYEEDDFNCISWGAISSSSINKNHISVIHNLPSIFLITPTKSDVIFFKRRVSYYLIDHLWQHLLIRESRLKVVGSSDIAFTMEITDENDKVPVKSLNLKNDRYIKIPPSFGVTNCFISSWIGNGKN
jgi:hypothetical protein